MLHKSHSNINVWYNLVLSQTNKSIVFLKSPSLNACFDLLATVILFSIPLILDAIQKRKLCPTQFRCDTFTLWTGYQLLVQRKIMNFATACAFLMLKRPLYICGITLFWETAAVSTGACVLYITNDAHNQLPSAEARVSCTRVMLITSCRQHRRVCPSCTSRMMLITSCRQQGSRVLYTSDAHNQRRQHRLACPVHEWCS